MKVLVCGGRNYADARFLYAYLDGVHRKIGITEIIHGAAHGADTLSGEFGSAREIAVRKFPANWETHGRAAGPIRNKQMLDEGKPDLVIAFPGGRGTANMVQQAKQANVTVQLVHPRSENDKSSNSADKLQSQSPR